MILVSDTPRKVNLKKFNSCSSSSAELFLYWLSIGAPVYIESYFYSVDRFTVTGYSDITAGDVMNL